MTAKEKRMNCETLTTTELEVIKLLADGFNLKGIAAKLDKSVGTIRSHQHNIYTKLRLVDELEQPELYSFRVLLVNWYRNYRETKEALDKVHPFFY